MSLHELTIAAALDEFRKHKRYAEKAFIQLRDEDFFVRINPQQCSIGAYIKHLSGNMLSRFTDWLTTDGEKPTRDREGEFAEQGVPRSELMAAWERGWELVLRSIESLTETDLEKTIYIRKEPHSVVLAITRQLTHYAYHVGQIVLIAKHIRSQHGESWNYMTIPPGESQKFNKLMGL